MRLSGWIALALLAGLNDATGSESALSLFPSGGEANYSTDERIYRNLERAVVRGAPLDLWTNRPVPISIFNRMVAEENDFSNNGRFKRWNERDWHLFEYRRDDSSYFQIDPYFTFGMNLNEDQSVIRRKSGIRFHGSIKGDIGYYFRFVDNTERGNGPYTKRSQLLEDKYGYVGPLMGGDETYYDATEAYLTYTKDWLNITFGKDRVSWGPGRRTNLLLSDSSPSFDQLRLKARPGESVQFTYLIGKLHPTSNMRGDTLYKTSEGWTRITVAQKWIVAHRLEYTPNASLLISVSEAVIWGDRGLDASFLNPLYFLYSAQHDGGDRDNVLLSGDFVARVAPSTLFYGALLIDDLKISKLGKDYVGNKLGFLLGLYAVDLPSKSIDLGVEYVRLEPFVYSHFFPINRFTNWNSALGADILPNSDRIELALSYRPTFDLTLNMAVANNRHGTAGGLVEESLPRALSQNIGFLDGQRSDWVSLNYSIEWEAFPGGVIEVGRITGQKQQIMPDRWYFTIGYRI